METEIPLGNKVLGREAEALRAIIEMLPTGVLLADADGKLLMHNRAAQEILGAEDATRGGPADWTAPFGWYLSDRTTLISPEELPLVRALRGEDICDHLVFIRHAARPEGVVDSSDRPTDARPPGQHQRRRHGVPGSFGSATIGPIPHAARPGRRTDCRRSSAHR